MKLIFALVLAFQLGYLESNAQVRTIIGKVLNESFDPVPQAVVWDSNSLVLGETNLDGTFKIDIPAGTKHFVIGAVAMERKDIYLHDSCNYLEIILLNAGTYDFMSPRKVDRMRLKYFKTLPRLQLKAYEKGFFLNPKPCYDEKFISEKQKT